jgi:4-amino-4-deoxy-L-arabinose transferase-like glycosyltransferase
MAKPLLNYMKTKYLLLATIIIASILRLYRLGSIPPHLTSDEAALGYNAYSILKTGRDEYGKFLPLVFKSFGDYKPGLYVYTAIPSVLIFGLNEFSVRLPSAIAGVISVLLIHLIVQELFKTEKLGLISSFLFAISPWSLDFSRGAWEANISLFLLLAGLYFFLLSFRKEKFLYIFSVFIALTFLTYQGAKISTLLFLISISIAYLRRIICFKKINILFCLLLFLAVASPVILGFFNGQGGRAATFNIFSYSRPESYLKFELDQAGEKKGDLGYYLYHPEFLNFLRGILGRWFNHFSGRFLFFEGDWANPRHSAPSSGMFILLDLVLILIGVVTLIREKISSEKVFIFSWALLSPLPAALTRDQVHAVRSYNMLIPLIVISSLGAYTIINKFNKKIIFIILSITYLVNYVYFLDSYFIHLPIHDSDLWNYGYKQMVEEIAPIQANYQKVLIPQSYSQPYIYFLFFQKYDPSKYQRNAQLIESKTGDVGVVEKLDNIYFINFDWQQNKKEHNVLIVGDPVQIPISEISGNKTFNLLKEIKYLNGDVAFRMLEIK